MTTTLDNVIGTRVAPVIVVFIDLQTQDTQKYAESWSDELVPFVDKTYRTIADASSRAHLGHGFGGFSALLLAHKYPNLANKVAIQSTFIFDSMSAAIDSLAKPASELPLDIYMDWGTYDLRNPQEAWDLARSNRELAKKLRDRGYALKGGEVHDGTGWSSWRNRSDVVFEAMFPLSGN
jgi:enterochelin esterase-like enzyme